MDSVLESAAEVRAELHAAGGEVLLSACQKGGFGFRILLIKMFYILGPKLLLAMGCVKLVN